MIFHHSSTLNYTLSSSDVLAVQRFPLLTSAPVTWTFSEAQALRWASIVPETLSAYWAAGQFYGLEIASPSLRVPSRTRVVTTPPWYISIQNIIIKKSLIFFFFKRPDRGSVPGRGPALTTASLLAQQHTQRRLTRKLGSAAGLVRRSSESSKA